jgi:hypothetical protein
MKIRGDEKEYDDGEKSDDEEKKKEYSHDCSSEFNSLQPFLKLESFRPDTALLR